MTPTTPPPLSDFIQVGARFLRSINLEKDYAGGQRNGDYIVTPNARQVLNRVAEGRRSLSSQSAGARRNLVEAMLTHGAQPALGIEGYPPERSMYESVLRATGLHTKGESDHWQMSAPRL
jgi:hypothetical protein